MVPQPDVIDGLRVVRDVGRRERGVPRQLSGVHYFEAERLAGRLDVPHDVGRFPLLFVRGDDQPLHGHGAQVAAHRDHRVEADGGKEWRVARGHRGDQTQRGADQRDEQQDPQHWYAQRDVDVRRTVDDAGRGGQDAWHIEIGTTGQQHEQRRDDAPEMAPRVVADRQPLRGVQRECARDDVGRGRSEQGQHDDGQRQVARQIEKRQREHVEAHIPSEQRVGLAKRRCMLKLQPGQPLIRREQPQEERCEGGHPGAEHLQLRSVQTDRLDVAASRED